VRRIGFPHVLAFVGGTFTFVLGIWAFVSPSSFYDALATYPPYNRHFLHDIGAFQAGLGAALLATLVLRDALFAGLAGFAVGSVLHAAAHAIDAGTGGRSTDPWLLGAFAAMMVVALVLRARELRRQR
jgi:hypothetical protein